VHFYKIGRSLVVPKGVFSFAKENTPFDSLPCARRRETLCTSCKKKIKDFLF